MRYPAPKGIFSAIPCLVLGILFAVGICSSSVAAADNRLFIDAEVDHKPVRLIFDTGWAGTSIVLFILISFQDET